MSSPNRKKDLAVEIGFLESLRPHLPEDLDVLRTLANDYTEVGRYSEGLAADLELSRLLPDDALVHYNLACSYSLLGHLKEAFDTLQRAIHLGYNDLAWINKDPDLENLRKSPEFSKILRLLKKPSAGR
jgi:tetratricopeptide (TPR) repeat protein